MKKFLGVVLTALLTCGVLVGCVENNSIKKENGGSESSVPQTEKLKDIVLQDGHFVIQPDKFGEYINELAGFKFVPNEYSESTYEGVTKYRYKILNDVELSVEATPEKNGISCIVAIQTPGDRNPKERATLDALCLYIVDACFANTKGEKPDFTAMAHAARTGDELQTAEVEGMRLIYAHSSEVEGLTIMTA